jgi:hypothetical protein
MTIEELAPILWQEMLDSLPPTQKAPESISANESFVRRFFEKIDIPWDKAQEFIRLSSTCAELDEYCKLYLSEEQQKKLSDRAKEIDRKLRE